MVQYYLLLDQKVWAYGDYTNSNTYALTGTIYTDEELTTAADITGLTLKIKLFGLLGETERLSDTADIVTAASGTWRYKPAQGKIPTADLYLVKIELSTSGSLISTINRVELLVRRGPTT